MAKAIKKEEKKKVVVSGYRPQIRSRHPSHDALRTELPRMPFRSLIRLGSTTDVGDGVSRVEINTPGAIRNSADKLRMKTCFMDGNVKTADWMSLQNNSSDEAIKGFCKDAFPIVLKHRFGSRGKGNSLHKDLPSLLSALRNKTKSDYIIEKFYNYNREYRLHVTSEGCFYTCRKMLKENTPEHERWFRNDSNSVWIMETNPQFDRPVNWDKVVEESVKALNSTGLDVGAVDLRIQSAKDEKGKNRKNPDFIVVEINSAASHGEVTRQRYLEELPRLLLRKQQQKK